MKPFDPRLLRYAQETRGYIIFLVILGLINTALIGAQIFFISAAASSIFYGTHTFNDIQPLLWLLLGTFILRSILTYIQKAVGHRSAVKVIANLRTQVLRHAGASLPLPCLSPSSLYSSTGSVPLPSCYVSHSFLFL